VSSKTTVDAAAARARASVYAFLASVFHSLPTEDSVRAVREMAGGLEIEDPGPFVLNDLEREFMDLLVVPSPRYVAPYESVYRDRWLIPSDLAGAPGPDGTPRTTTRLLMGESTLAVRQCFREAGVEPTDDLPDHISNELKLMSHLWSGEGQEPCGESGRLAGLRSKLRDDHLLRWVGELQRRVSEHDRSGLYSTALRVVEVVLENDGN